MVFFTDAIAFNPALQEETRKIITRCLLQQSFDEPHVWISTSGSFAQEGISKWAALSIQAFLASAEAVNEHIEATPKDIWLNPLPLFHVGGLGIKYRAYLAKAKEVDFLSYTPKWSPLLFMKALDETKATLTALVPTQLFDLMAHSFHAPPSLRAALVGGGGIAKALYFKARNFGWNLLPTYGLTESASQVATAPLDSLQKDGLPPLQILKHMQLFSDDKGVLSIKSSSLLTTYGIIEKGNITFYDPKEKEIFTTSDRGEIRGRNLVIYGRVDDIVKILGENVDVAKLQKIADTLKLTYAIEGDFHIEAIMHERRENTLCLYTTADSQEREQFIRHFNQQVFPFERITHVEHRVILPKTALGKIERKKLIIK